MQNLPPINISTLLPMAVSQGDLPQLPPAPIVAGVPKLLYSDGEVATMLGISVSTVRNRYNRMSKWHDPNFPVPRHTGGESGRKSAVRWYWDDICRYVLGLPQVPYGYSAYTPVRPSKADTRSKAGAVTYDSANKPFEI